MMEKFFNRNKDVQSKPLSKIFYELENSEASPYELALNSFNELKKSTNSTEELFYFLIEDSIYISLYATFYEELFKCMKANLDKASDLIKRFADASEERERLIATEAQNHVNYIENLGACDGCQSCENHKDVVELISSYQNGDLDFFIDLYIGMQTIQNSMEALIYDILPDNEEFIEALSVNDIMEWRSQIFSYAQLKTSDYLHNN